MFNCVSLVFDSGDFLINMKLFLFIVSRGALPIYILSEIVDNLTRLAQSGHALYKWRQFIYKLKKLKDVRSSAEDGEGSQLQCCICLGDIATGKQLSCGHVFHLVCLRSWLIEKVECPTCRKPIQLDKQPQPAAERRRRAAGLERRIQQERRLHIRNAGGLAGVDPGNQAEESSGVDGDLDRASDREEPEQPKTAKGKTKGIFEPERRQPKKDADSRKAVRKLLLQELGPKGKDGLAKHEALMNLFEETKGELGDADLTEPLMSKEETERRMKDREGYARALKGVSALDKGVLDEIEKSTLTIPKVEDGIEEERRSDLLVSEQVEEVKQATGPSSALIEELKTAPAPEMRADD